SLGQFAAVIGMRKQVAVDITGQHNAGMTEPRLHRLDRQFQPAVFLSVDAPTGIKMPRRMQPGIFGFAFVVDDTCLDLHWLPYTTDNVGVAFGVSYPVGEGQITFPLRTGEPPFLQRIENERAERDGAIT